MPYKDLEKRKQYHNEYMKKWKKQNKDKWKIIQKKSESRPERKEYLKNWWAKSPKAKKIKERFRNNHPKIEKEYNKKYREKNPDKVKEKYERYCKTPKGILNQINKVQTRRKKFKILTKTYNQRPPKSLIKVINARDLVCVYCKKKFSDDKTNKRDYRTYDHLNAFKPHGSNNTVKCCGECNSSKADREVLEWCKSKGFTPAPIIFELLKKQIL